MSTVGLPEEKLVAGLACHWQCCACSSVALLNCYLRVLEGYWRVHQNLKTICKLFESCLRVLGEIFQGCCRDSWGTPGTVR